MKCIHTHTHYCARIKTMHTIISPSSKHLNLLPDQIPVSVAVTFPVITFCITIFLSAHFLKSLEESAKAKGEKVKEKGHEHKRYGNVLFRSGQYGTAVEEFTQALKYMPCDVSLYTNRALVGMLTIFNLPRHLICVIVTGIQSTWSLHRSN